MRNSTGGSEAVPSASSTDYQHFLELRVKNEEKKNGLLIKQLRQSKEIIKTYE